jgi:NF-X1-type zinc finger protein NFXL1
LFAHADVTVDGSASILGNMSVAGSQTVAGTLDVTQDLSAHADMTVDGSASILGNLDVVGSQTIAGTLSVTQSLNASSDVTIDGVLIMNNSLTVNSNASISGTLDVTQDLSAHADVTVDGSASILGNMSVAGSQSVAGTFDVTQDLSAHADFTLDGSASILGNMSVAGSQSVAGTLDVTQDFSAHADVTVDGSASILGNMSVAGVMTVEDQFYAEKSIDVTQNLYVRQHASVDGSLNVVGSANINGDFTVNSDKLYVNSSTGDVNVNNNTVFIDGANGALKTVFPYSSYVLPSSSSNESTTLYNNGVVDFTSTTSQYLATQTYVDQELWKQTIRINTVLGTDASAIDSFNNVYTLVKALEGDTTATAINGLVNKASQINQSVSTVVASAFNSVLINCVSSVWGSNCQPMPIPSTVSQSYLCDGWYFKNLRASNNISWKIPQNGSNMLVKDCANLYMNIFAVSNKSLPSISIFTQPLGDGTDINVNYNSKIDITFAVTGSTSLTSNTNYCLYAGSVTPNNLFNVSSLSASSITITSSSGSSSITSLGQVDSSLKVNYFILQTDANATVNNCEIVLQSFNVQKTSGTTQFIFQNGAVSANYLFNNFFRKNIDFTNLDTYNTTYLSDYNAVYNAV